MTPRLREYTVTVSKLWGKQISGPVLSGIGLSILIAQQFVKDGPIASGLVRVSAWLTLGVAALMVFAAQYRAWTEERNKVEEERGKVEAEARKNARPDIRGVASSFEVGVRSESSYPDMNLAECHGIVQFTLTVCNHRPVPTNISRIEIDGSKISPPIRFSGSQLSSIYTEPPELRPGFITTLFCRTEVTASGSKWTDISPVDLRGLVVRVIDGFGDAHMMEIAENSVLDGFS